MKRPIAAILSILMMLLAFIPAKGGTYWLSHCNGELASKSELAYSGAAEVSVATPFFQDEMEAYRGNSIVALRIGIISRLKLDGLDVWVARTPGDTPLRSVRIPKADLQSGWNEIRLDLPLEVTGETLYLGYTFSQPSQCNVISLVPTDGSYPLMTDAGEGWTDNPAGDHRALSVELGIEGENLAEYDMDIARFEPLYREMEAGSMAYFKADIYNSGLEPAETLEYVIESAASEATRTVQLYGLQPREKTDLYVKIPLQEESGNATATFRLLSVNGHALPRTKESVVDLSVFSPSQAPRRVLLEEFSNEYCGNCPAGSERIHKAIAAMDVAGKVDLVVHHAGSGYDLFTADASKEYEVLFSASKYSPMLAADRTPYGGHIDMVPGDIAEIETRIESALRIPAGSSLWMEPFVDSGKGIVEITARGTASETENLKLTLFLTESNVKSRNQYGATRDYLHQDMLRSVSSVWGEPVSAGPDGIFEQRGRLSFLSDWKAEECRLIAFLTAGEPDGKGISKVIQTYSLPMLCAEEKEIPSDSGISSTSEDRIVISVKEGRLTVTGDYAYVRLYDISGREVDSARVPDGISIAVVGAKDGGTVIRKIQK